MPDFGVTFIKSLNTEFDKLIRNQERTPLNAQLSHTSVFTMCLCVTSLFALWCTVYSVRVAHVSQMGGEKIFKSVQLNTENPPCMMPSSPNPCLSLLCIIGLEC